MPDALPIDPGHFRKVLSAYPTGVCVIAAQDGAGRKHAMVVGSFTSISLDPPLVGFYPARTSSSWAAMAPIGSFAISVRGADQLAQCQQFAARGMDKFGDLAHGATAAGHPLIDDALAWFDCTLEATHEVGDHYLVVGRVVALDGQAAREPLLFYGGQYHGLGQAVTASPQPA